ncbi:hypothetical protein FPV67DRAFT_1527382 [Lyophyllum atratum]|nr:hypothetical protein FPV67DRAFT_1527382 [Lyophyllum atratum]
MEDIKVLKESRDQKRKEVEFQTALLSPARLLPPGILARIFQYAASFDRHGPGPRFNAAPFGLSHVCATWRAAALGCSDLWNRLALQPADPFPGSAWSYIFSTVMVSWFERANPSLPLSFSFTHHGYTPYLAQDIEYEICRKIAHFSPRFLELHLALDEYSVLLPFLSLPGDSLPFLETLFFVGGKKAENYSRITLFKAAPRLRAVTLHNIRSSVDRLSISLPWSQLSHLEIKGDIRLAAFATVIFQCTQIESASFASVNLYSEDSSDTQVQPTWPDDVVTLARLMTLTLVFWESGSREDLDRALGILDLPKLQTLTLVGDYGHDACDILSNVEHNVTRLRHLILDAHEDADTIAKFIEISDMLETLTVCRCDLNPDIMLKHLRRSASLVHLASFTFALSYNGYYNGSRFLEEVLRVADEFCDLISSWMEDPSRQRPLESLSWYIYDIYGKEADEVRAVLERTQTRIRGLKGYGRGGEVVFNTDVFETYKQFSQAVGL